MSWKIPKASLKLFLGRENTNPKNDSHTIRPRSSIGRHSSSNNRPSLALVQSVLLLRFEVLAWVEWELVEAVSLELGLVGAWAVWVVDTRSTDSTDSSSCTPSSGTKNNTHTHNASYFSPFSCSSCDSSNDPFYSSCPSFPLISFLCDIFCTPCPSANENKC